MMFNSKTYITPVDKYPLNNCANKRLAHKEIVRQNVYSYCKEVQHEVRSTL